MEEISSWVAPIATAIAACMTAANLGARVTGWGFVVFTIGSIGWTTYGFLTDQSNLLWQNLFLTAVNLTGVWRWLGRQARFDEGAHAAAEDSTRRPGPTLFAVSSLAGAELAGADGAKLGTTVDAMAHCTDGRIDYLVVSSGGVGGVGAKLRALPWEGVRVDGDTVRVGLDEAGLEALAAIDPTDWPTEPQPLPRTAAPA